MNIIQAVYSVRKDAVVILEGGGMLMICCGQAFL